MRRPFYGLRKFGILVPQFDVYATSNIPQSRITLKTEAQIQKVPFYDIGCYDLGYFRLDVMKPQKVFLAFSLQKYMGYRKSKTYTKGRLSGGFPYIPGGWYEGLEELTVRIDTGPEEKETLKSNELMEGMVVKKVGGRVLGLVSGKKGTLGTWKGVDLSGNRVEWHSVTYVWWDASLR